MTQLRTHTDGSRSMPPAIRKLVGNGSFGVVWQIAHDRVLKEPKIYSEKDENSAYFNFMNRSELQNEKVVYERLGSHNGIIQCFSAQVDSLELAFAEQGNLEDYMKTNPIPSRQFRTKWIRSVVDIFDYAHSRRVVISDVGLRNILVHLDSLKLSDFGEAFMLPLDADMGQFNVNDVTPRIEILHLGCILYSIAVWQEFKSNYFDNERWPDAGELPTTDEVLFADIIQKCWNGGYASMEALRVDVSSVKDE